MIIILYLLIAVAVILLSIKLSQYVDLIDKKTHLSGAFIGAIFLSAVTSLPELFTTASAVFLVHQPDLIFGNILGSNIFNVTVLCIIFLFTSKNFFKGRLSAGHKSVVVYALFMYGLIGLSFLLRKDGQIFTVSYVSIGMILLYILSIRRLSQDTSEAGPEEESGKLTIRQILVRFVILSLVLIGMSVALTYTTDIIAAKYHIGTTLAGAVLLGIATSLPEVSATIALARMKNYDAMVGNIMGSNLFNFAILFVGDILCTTQSLYHLIPQTVALVGFGALNTFCVLVVILQKESGGHQGLSRKLLFIGINFIAMASYVVFLIYPY